MIRVGWLMIALLACAVAAVIGAEWPRFSARYGNEARRRRERNRGRWNVGNTALRMEMHGAAREIDLEQ